MRGTIETRLLRLETRCRPAPPQVATCIMASSRESGADQIVQQIARGAHQEGWPPLVVTSPGFQEPSP